MGRLTRDSKPDPQPIGFQVTLVGKLFPHMYLGLQAVQFGTVNVNGVFRVFIFQRSQSSFRWNCFLLLDCRLFTFRGLHFIVLLCVLGNVTGMEIRLKLGNGNGEK